MRSVLTGRAEIGSAITLDRAAAGDLSFDRHPCTGTLDLTAGPRRWPAGRKRFAIAPGAAKRIRVTLSTRARRVLRRRGHVTLTATAVTTEPGGTFGATKARIVVNSRRSR
jgi:hypothetical protein